MRDIKFRGKRVDNGEWAYGDLITFGGTFIMHPTFEFSSMLTTSKVIPETVGQFTGLTDRNGKEIYEGDICEWNGWGVNISKVLFKNGMFSLHDEWGGKGQPIGKKYKWQDMGASGKEDLNLRVIGNIYDNPELCEQ